MSLVRAYAVDFSPSGGMPLISCKGLPPNRTTVDYQPLDRFEAGWGWYARARAELWQDNNHSQMTVLFLPAICFADGSGGGLVDPSKTMPADLDLCGAELRTEILCNVLYMAKDVQLVTLAQWFDTEANLGRGANVNYIHTGEPTVCEALGFQTPYYRPTGGEERSSGWVEHVTRFDPEDSAWHCIYGNAAKVQAGVYAGSETTERAFRSRLLDIMHVFHCGPTAPEVRPMERAAGGLGELYYRKWELWVDPARNPGIVAV